MASTSSPFGPVGPGGNFRHNAMFHGIEDDAALGFGYISAGEALVQHWVEHGPNDGLLMPIIMNYRHGIELLLKAAIAQAAACIRRNGYGDTKTSKDAIAKWLALDAGHSLQALANRLDEYLVRLQEDKMPADTHALLMSLHTLDPRGDTFRYATTFDKQQKKYVPAPRPKAAHLDVVAMGAAFNDAASLIGGGVLTILEMYREMQSEWGP